MNVIQKAVDEIKYRIPKAILEKAFLPYNAYGRVYNSTNIDEQIKNNVIRARVLIDCNLIGGTQAVIPLEGLAFEKPTDVTTVIHIPKDRTQGKSINSVLNVAFISPQSVAALSGSLPSIRSYNSNATMQAVQGMMQAFDTIPVVSTARVQLIGENTILIKDNIILSPTSFLRCVLANDDELTNIQLRSYRYFANLVEYAVKSYIYNELIINMDQGQLQGGATLGIFKEVISGYSDAEQNYRDYLKDVWEVVAFQNDFESYERYIKLITGGNR